MLSVALLYILAVVFSATRALPLYPDTVLTPQEDLLQKLVTEVEEGQSDDLSEQRDVKTVFPLLLQQERDRDSWPKDAKETLQQAKMNNMVDDLKAVMLKLAAADNLRSQGFLRSEQNLPKPNKRACFWKYCVTN
ncbi:urotensin-related peptide 1 [Salminus brasiliensis]|uniref:urotensin-related peptide 1 n=1 Tax=Salminus brasiliensis TaxID=930266 RepID=UPI003B83537C